MTLKFDKDTHVYQMNGKNLLSVTSVLPDIPDYLLCKQTFIDKTLLGSRVHDCADTINQHMMNGGDIPDESYYWGLCNTPNDRPYIEAYKNFLRAKRPTIVASEMRMYHPLLNYAGTIDMVAWIGNKSYIIDLKTSSGIAPYAKLQLVAYLKLWNYTNKPSVFRRAIVHLLPTGDYKFVTYPVKEINADFDIFLCKLRSAQWDAVNKVHAY